MQVHTSETGDELPFPLQPVMELGRPPDAAGEEVDPNRLYSRLEVATAVTLCVGQPKIVNRKLTTHVHKRVLIS